MPALAKISHFTMQEKTLMMQEKSYTLDNRKPDENVI